MTNEDRDVNAFLSRAFKRSYRSNTTIISSGKNIGKDPKIHYLIKGSVAVVLDEESGHELTLAHIHEGDFFGEVQFFLSEDASRQTRIVSRTNCQTAALPRQVLNALIQSHPELLWRITAQLARRLATAESKASLFAYKDVKGRILYQLHRLTKRPEAKVFSDGIEISISTAELSLLVGCSKEMATKTINSLKSEGSIAANRGIVRVLNVEEVPVAISQ